VTCEYKKGFVEIEFLFYIPVFALSSMEVEG